MYLNIINNINYESKKTEYAYDQEKSKGEDDSLQYIEDEAYNCYYSVFYGNLTKTWIKIRN